MSAERPWTGRRMHLVGLGGAGMSGYARVAMALGARVSGSDRAAEADEVQPAARPGPVRHRRHRNLLARAEFLLTMHVRPNRWRADDQQQGGDGALLLGAISARADVPHHHAASSSSAAIR